MSNARATHDYSSPTPGGRLVPEPDTSGDESQTEIDRCAHIVVCPPPLLLTFGYILQANQIHLAR